MQAMTGSTCRYLSGLDSLLPWRMQILKANLHQLIGYISAQGIRVALVTYPNVSNVERGATGSRAMREVAAAYPAVMLVDVDRFFLETFSKHELTQMNADGWHPTARGYEVTATKIMDTLVASDVL